jgi:hypothetical protein
MLTNNVHGKVTHLTLGNVEHHFTSLELPYYYTSYGKLVHVLCISTVSFTEAIYSSNVSFSSYACTKGTAYV